MRRRKKPGIAVLACVLTAALAGCQSSTDSPAANAERKLDLATDQTAFENSPEQSISAGTYVAAGRLAESRGQFGQAIRQYRQALKLDENHNSAMFHLGAVLTRTREFSAAIQTWQRYLKATGNSAAAYCNLALCYEAAGRTADAVAAFEKAIEKDPRHAATRVNYGLMLARQGKIPEAAHQLAHVLSPAQVHYNLGSIFQQKGQMKRARVEYEVALKLDPSLEPARMRLQRLPAPEQKKQ